MDTAANFSLPDQNNQIHSLADYRGSWLVLYFYPKDDTPGCTTQACGFRDDYDIIAQYAKLVGISKDSVASHAKFSAKHSLNFPILADTDHQVIKAYDSWRTTGTQRNTFIINPEGQIAKRYDGVNPQGHSQQIIKDLQQLQSEA